MKRVVGVALGDESLAVTYDRDALIEATAEGDLTYDDGRRIRPTGKP